MVTQNSKPEQDLAPDAALRSANAVQAGQSVHPAIAALSDEHAAARELFTLFERQLRSGDTVRLTPEKTQLVSDCIRESIRPSSADLMKMAKEKDSASALTEEDIHSILRQTVAAYRKDSREKLGYPPGTVLGGCIANMCREFGLISKAQGWITSYGLQQSQQQATPG